MREPLTKSGGSWAAHLPIGELSRRTGCNIETIRYYEKIGVLPPPRRTEGGHRIYGADHVRRLSFVCRARGLGFTLEEVRALLRLDEQGQPCAEVKEVAVAHLTEVRSKVADLRAMEAALEILVSRCAEGEKSGCPLIEALAN